MRKLIAAAACGLVLSVAGASSRDDVSPEARAYFGFSFGGQQVAPRDLHYGFRLDQDSRFGDGATAPVVQLDFTTRGFNDARLNGLSVIKRHYRLKQTDAGSEDPEASEGGDTAAEPAAAEEPAADNGASETGSDGSAEAAAPADSQPAQEDETGETEEVAEEEETVDEDEGFFEAMFGGVASFFGGLFGGDEEEAEETETAAADEDDVAEEGDEDEVVTEGVFLGYNAVDWAAFAVGAVGLGYAVSELSEADEDADPRAPAPPPPPGCATTTVTSTCIPPAGFRSSQWLTPYDERGADPEYREWLDGGTGHMGDLGG